MSNSTERQQPGAVLIAGPTASGKSALALELAEAMDGVVVNADSMQVYRDLQVLTARPDAAESARVPHYLYGHVAADEAYSVGRWTRDVTTLLKSTELHNRVPVFVGGTGLYFRALLGGLSAMPTVPEEIRNRWRARLRTDGPQVLHAELQMRDAPAAARLDAGDSQRIVRALEVLDTTGQSIDVFQARSGKALIDQRCARKIVLLPDREVLRIRIGNRFMGMMDGGAVEEVQKLLVRGLPDDLPAMKAIGVREIGAYLAGRSSLDEAVNKAVTATRQYAKRQMTWFRNQLGTDWERRTELR